MHTKKQHIVRKTIIVSVSFLLGIVSTVIAAATYDANIQTRATKMFNTIKSNANTLATADQQAYYSCSPQYPITHSSTHQCRL